MNQYLVFDWGGTFLKYAVMNEDTEILQDTMYSCYTAAGYSRWKDDMIAMATRYQQEMNGLNRQTIIGHDQLSDEVSVTIYQDGTKVYVNYGNTDFRASGKKIPARDYLVERGNGQ